MAMEGEAMASGRLAFGFGAALNPGVLRRGGPVCKLVRTTRRLRSGPGGAVRVSQVVAKGDDSRYKNTVNLPQTNFSQRANAVKREPELQHFWQTHRIYEELSRNNPNETFTLHDGPPYANGALHMGHALNKVLKDIINRYQLMKGKKSVFVPGWDCHGLPIELKVLQSMKSKERSNSTPLQLRQRARDFALETVDAQRNSFKRLGVWADWEEPYLTLTPEYEAAQIAVFGSMFLNGHIYRGKKPVHWSPSTRTALAEAELEYPEGHVSTSCYAAFRAVDVSDCASEDVKSVHEAGDLRVSVWTTTPWTLPANEAVSVNPEMEYSLVQRETKTETLIVATGLVATLSEKLGETLKIVATLKGSDLVGIIYRHPAEEGKTCRVIAGGDYITADGGTGLVHTAPGHGQDDYIVGMREGLRVFAPVDGAGKFTAEAANGKFTGLNVLGEGNKAVLDYVEETGDLLLQEPYQHKYPYDWRSKKPTIFRATEQWFASVDGFREAVLNEIGNVEWLPAIGETRIRGMITGRSDWCISRQRSWGVPIPVFYEETTGEAILNESILTRVESLFRERGSDVWYELEADEILPEEFRGRGLVKGTDTMDVWFDSGTSWNGVANSRAELTYPVDLYLEGSDQHRGWFQSSLLTSVASRGKAPYKTVLTHGFVLDEKGFKMSKSIGNVVDPLAIVEGGNNKKKDPAYGADVLRLWVSSVDSSGDVLIGPGIVQQISDTYRKLRNTARYLIGNTHDFTPKRDAVAFADLPSLDKYMLRRLKQLSEEIDAAYASYTFSRIYQALLRFAVVDLSNFYLDIAKDRLYISSLDSPRRRTCQTVLSSLLESLSKAMAPILPHMAEDLWQNMAGAELPASSIFQQGWMSAFAEVESDDEEDAQWQILRDIRTDVNKCLDTARGEKLVGSSLEARVSLFSTDPATIACLKKFSTIGNDVDELPYLLIVSQVNVVSSALEIEECAFSLEGENASVTVGVSAAVGTKCERCWNYCTSVGSIEGHPTICSRCDEALKESGNPVPPLEAPVS